MPSEVEIEIEDDEVEIEIEETPEALERKRLESLQRKWRKVIEDRRPIYEAYWRRADSVVARFEDIRDVGGYKGAVPSKVANRRQYNMLWANTETLQPVLFNKVPDPVVKRRWPDNSPVARSAAEMLERVTTLNAKREDVSFVDHVNAAVFNILVPGTGVLWARYAPEMTEVDVDGIAMPQIGDQKVIADYVHWRDLMCAKANVWSQVTWLARKLFWPMSRVEREFGEEAALMCEPQKKDGDKDKNAPLGCEILEIWDKTTKEVLFFNKDATRILKVVPDPLKLSCFYPCPKPLFAVWSTDDVVPIPYYCQYQDQAAELDQVTTQIYTLLKAARVVGVYNEAMGADFQQMLDSGTGNKMVPVTDWPDFMNKGGMEGNVAMLDLRQVVEENLVQMSGMDLPTQQEKMMLQFQVQQADMAGQPIPDEVQERLAMPTVEEVIAMLRSDKLRGFSLDIESDSTIEGDDAKEREDRSKFIDVLTGMVERWAPIVSAAPEMLPMVSELVMFAIRPFHAGRGPEEAVERTFEQLQRAAKEKAKQPPPPDPMDKATQAEMQKTQMQEAGDTHRTELQEAGDTQRKIMDIASKQDETRVKAIAEVAKQVVAGE